MHKLPETPPAITQSVEVLMTIARDRGAPLILAVHPPENDHGLKYGESAAAETNELLPSVSGVVIAFQGSPEETQRLVDAVLSLKIGE